MGTYDESGGCHCMSSVYECVYSSAFHELLLTALAVVPITESCSNPPLSGYGGSSYS